MELLKLTLENNLSLNLYCNVWVWVLILVFGVLFAFFTFINGHSFFRKQVDIDVVELGIGKNKVQIKPNYQTIQIAYKLWVELNTRKLGLPIDENNDVIAEIYDSWYAFFTIARELIKDIPAQKAKNKDTKELILLSSKILNQAVRPHLTKWQARFRGWYDKIVQKTNTCETSPQELQKKFKCSDTGDCYKTLINDMIEVNKKLIYYKKILEKIVFGEEING